MRTNTLHLLWVDIAETENASLRAGYKTTEAIKKITRNREKHARIKIEQQLATVQEFDNAQIDVIVAKDGKTRKREMNMRKLSQVRRISCQDQVRKHLKKKKSNYSSFQNPRSSCNEDMVKYEGPRPSTTRARALNENSNKKIPPATSQPLGWRVCRPAEGVSLGRRPCHPALGAYVFHFTLEETRITKKDLDPLN
nr:hypothetical protein [Tanacetum cinerariifolium]